MAGLTLHYNVNVDMTSFVHTMFGETADVAIVIEPDNVEISTDFRERMASRPDIDMIFRYAPISLLVDGELLSIIAVQDFSYLAGHSLISGILPSIPSGVVLDTDTLSRIGKNVSDWVTVRSGDISYDYIITGVVQGGNQGMMNLEGVRRVRPDFAFRTFCVNLTEGTDIEQFIESIRASEDEILIGVLCIQEQLDSMLTAMGNILPL